MDEKELIKSKGEQPAAIISDKELEFLIGREFPNNIDIVKSKINKISSDTQKGKNRIAAAVLKIANKDFDKIDHLIDKANNDFRDIISEAEYQTASKYDLGERNEEESIQDYLEDWEEYSAWRIREK